MALFQGLTNPGQIRSVLGIAESEELTDAYVIHSGVAEELEADLLSWVTYPVADLITLGTGTSPTAKARKQYLWLAAYAKYFCAAQIAISFSILIQKSISDGQNEVVRQNQNLEDLLGLLRAARDSFKSKFLTESGQAPAVPAGIMSVISPSYDPVTHTTT